MWTNRQTDWQADIWTWRALVISIWTWSNFIISSTLSPELVLFLVSLSHANTIFVEELYGSANCDISPLFEVKSCLCPLPPPICLCHYLSLEYRAGHHQPFYPRLADSISHYVWMWVCLSKNWFKKKWNWITPPFFKLGPPDFAW